MRGVVAGMLWVTVLVGCSAPARRLPSRPVDDPITLPRRMVEVELLFGSSLTEPEDSTRWERPASYWTIGRGPNVIPGIRYGISDRVTLTSPSGVTKEGIDDRLTLTGPTAVTVALLDDAPPQYASTGWCAPGSPVGLSLTVGVDPLYREYSGVVFFYPLAVAHVRKRLGPVLRLDGRLGARGVVGRTSALFSVHAEAGITAQLRPRVAIGFILHDALQRWHNSVTAYPWTREALGVATEVLYRIRPMVTVVADLDLGAMHRTAAATSTPNPERPSAVAADTWFVLAAHVGARLHW